MPTIVNITVKPSGGDYTLLSSALAAVPTDLVAVDEQWNVICSEFVGGLLEAVTVPTITQDATRYLHIQTEAGHEYDFSTDTGFILKASVGFSAVLVNAQNHTRISGIGVHNMRTLGNARGLDNFGNDTFIDNVFSTTDGTSGSLCYFLNNANFLDIRQCIAYKGTDGFDFGNNSVRTGDKLLALDATTFGFDRGSAAVTLTNCLSLGAGTDFDAGFLGNNNASQDATAAGANSLTGRSTADLADYASNDFRTASGSALATAGVGGTFIGYALEQSSSVSVTPDSVQNSQSITEVTLVQGYTLIPEDLNNVQSVSESSFVQSHQLASNDISNTGTLSNVALSQNGTLLTQEVLQATNITEPSIVQDHILSLQNIGNSSSLSDISLIQKQFLTAQPMVNISSLSESTLTQAHVLSVDNIVTGQSLTEAVLTVAGVLGVDSLNQGNTTTEIEFIQNHLLAVDNINSAQGLTESDLTMLDNLIVDHISSSTNITDSGLTQHNILLSDPITNNQFVGVVSFGGKEEAIASVVVSYGDANITATYTTAMITLNFKE